MTKLKRRLQKISCCLCLALPCSKQGSKHAQKSQVVEKVDVGASTVHNSELYTIQRERDRSPIDVHICKSHLCTCCHSETSGIKFIKVAPEIHEKQDPAPPSRSTQTNPHPLKLIIENITAVGAIRAYSTNQHPSGSPDDSNDQKQGQNDDELIIPGQTESLSDDESVIRFIESIENGSLEDVSK